MTPHLLRAGGSVVLAAAQLGTMLLLARKRRSGWLVSITASLVAVPYDILTGQYGFIAVDAVCLWTAVRAWFAWRQESRPGLETAQHLVLKRKRML